MGSSTGWAGCVPHSLESYESSRVGQGESLLMQEGKLQLRWRDGEKTDFFMCRSWRFHFVWLWLQVCRWQLATAAC